MVDVGQVNSDSSSVDASLKKYASLISGLGGSWTGFSHDSIEKKALDFYNEYSSKISSQMTSFGNAVGYYHQYETAKKNLQISKDNYNEAVKAKDDANIKRFSDDCDKYAEQVEDLKAKIIKCLNEVMSVKSSGSSSSTTVSAPKSGKWSSYKDAVAAGFSNIMTEAEFARSKSEYKTYQDYLNAMYDKYVTNSTANLEYQPKIKNGNIDTKLMMNDPKTYDDTAKYDGEYIEFENKDGIKVRAPLAIAKYENGKIVYTPMTAEQKEQYINKVTHYYNDIMENSEKYSDKFKNETGDRVDSLTFVYIDPASRDKIDAIDGCCAYCQRTGNFSNHSDILVSTDEFIDLDDPSNTNTPSSYDYMVDAYTHELGHAYGNNMMLFPDRDTDNFWNVIYDKVNNDPANTDILRDYSLKNQKELFADATAYYYTDPDRLKQVPINVEVPATNIKFETLYDYMDFVLN